MILQTKKKKCASLSLSSNWEMLQRPKRHKPLQLRSPKSYVETECECVDPAFRLLDAFPTRWRAQFLYF